LHFLTSYSPYFAPELARLPLKRFTVLRPPTDDSEGKAESPADAIVYYHTTAEVWGRQRPVVITYNPTTVRKKRYDRRDKLEQVRQVLYELRRNYREGQRHWRNPDAVRAHYDKLCDDLHLSAKFFDLRFDREHGQPLMTFRLNR
jgi:hypothetical protein